MTKVSKRILDKDLEDRMMELFSKTIVNIKNVKDAENFLDDLFSPTEKVMIVKRFSIAILLTKKFTYDQIDNALKVSRATIMNVSFWLKNGKEGYKNTVEKIIKQEKNEELIDKIEEILLKLSLPKAYGSVGYRKKQKKGKELFRRKLKRSPL